MDRVSSFIKRSWLASSIAIAIFTSVSISALGQNFDLTVIQTADIHSHFTNRESPLSRGGLARVLWKINDIRRANQNTLLLDAGDWSEGNMFFTLDTGETSQRLISTMNYDAIVLGNHDWLVGPQALFDAFENTGFKTPVLSGNINMSHLDPKINLQKYIKPYVVKDFNGVKVGIFGVSTFQLIYDSYFKPVTLKEPLAVADEYVNILRKKEKCQIVIMLSHLGIETDKIVGKLIPGIDYIVGGHTHILLTKPAFGGSTPITHVGAWGQYVGETHLSFDGKKAHLVSYKAHPIEATLPEDPMMKNLVDGAIAQMEAKYGNIYNDSVVTSDVDLPNQRLTGESVVANWAVDAIRDAGQAEVAFDTPFFASRDFFKGTISTADFFNAFPHIFNPVTQKAWTVKTFQLNGLVLKILIEFVEALGFSLEVSDGKIVMNNKKIHKMTIADKSISDFRDYKIASTDGIWSAIEFFKDHGIDLGAHDFEDTNIEAWRLILKAVQQHSPITKDKITWEGRIRTLQPDLDMRPEEIDSVSWPNNQTELIVKVRNAGMTTSAPTTLTASTTENDNSPLIQSQISVGALEPGATEDVRLFLNTLGRLTGKTPLHLHLDPVNAESKTANNDLDMALDIP